MGLFDLFKKGEDPLTRYQDDVLGPMVWSEDDEAWGGQYCGIRYLIAYDRQATPKNELLGYARMVLVEPGAFESTVERAKGTAVAEMPKFADEIAGLRIGTVYFYTYKGMTRILAHLKGGEEEGRSWRVEFGEDGCEGIGFDT